MFAQLIPRTFKFFTLIFNQVIQKQPVMFDLLIKNAINSDMCWEHLPKSSELKAVRR